MNQVVRIFAFGLVAVTGLRCAAPAKPHVSPANVKQPASTANPSRVELAKTPAEQPLTAAHWAVLSDLPDFFTAYTAGVSQHGSLGPGRMGYLGANGVRMLATLSELRTLSEPAGLESLCVADDQRTTFAVARVSAGVDLLRGDTFEGPLIRVGAALTLPSTSQSKPHWLVRTDTGTHEVDCASGKMERVASAVDRAEELMRTDRLEVVRLGVGKQNRCVFRTLPAGDWTEAPACYAVLRVDHSVELNAELPADWAKRKLKARCLFVLDATGKRLPCTTKIGDWLPNTPAHAPETIQLENARYFAPGRIVAPGASGRLLRLDVGSSRELSSLGPTTLADCKAVLPTLPLFACSSQGTHDAMVRVDADGTLHEELRRPKRSGRGDRVATAADGGVAVAGNCSGELEQSACVRDVGGNWHTVPFSPAVREALTRTAPGTQLIPRGDGVLFIGTGSTEKNDFSDIRLQLLRADQGPAVAIERLPAWILVSLAKTVDFLSYAFEGSRVDARGPAFSFPRPDVIRLFPFPRESPAFGMSESCSAEVSLDGKLTTQCVPGVVSVVGRLGVLQKGPRELFETLDAGVSFRPIALPAGLDVAALECVAIGCHSGPYYRLGWGSD